jgi:ABC-type transporter Mla subunit MlaD
MNPLTTSLKKITLAILILGFGLAVLPTARAAAAPELADEGKPPAGDKVAPGRLKQTWEKLQEVYATQGERLEKSGELLARVQSLIDKAEARGLDTSAVQAALDALSAVLPAAQVAHEPGAHIIASHAGFDEKGNIEDLETAMQTVRSLAEVLKDTRAAMGGTGEALRNALRAFLEANRPARAEAPAP